MKFVLCFIKTFMENLRDWKIIILALIFAPFFIYMMYFYLDNPDSSQRKVLILNYDQEGKHSNELIKELSKLKTDDGRSILGIQIVSDSVYARKEIMNRNADLLLTIPADFSASLNRFITYGDLSISALKNYGDQANINFMTAASLVDYLAFNYLWNKTGLELPAIFDYEYSERGKRIDEFDLYVPAMMILAIIMILFTAGASIVRELEKDTITRLRLSKLNSFEFLAALSVNQVIIGVICVTLSFLAALSTGYENSGSFFLVLITGILTCLSVIGISIITCCFIKTMFALLTLGCFPFFILMFFSDCFAPLPKINIFQIAGNQVYLNDVLPTATATRALNKILNYNAGFSDISFELTWILVLSVAYLLIGAWFFRKKYKY